MMNEDASKDHFVVEGATGKGIKIVDTKQVPKKDKPGKFVSVYVIQVTMFGKTWTVEKRYNQFLALHQNLQERFPNAALFIVAKFPQRLIFHTDQDLYKRKLIFETYLEHALKDDKIRGCAHMKFFLQYPSSEETYTDPHSLLLVKYLQAIKEQDLKTISSCFHEEAEFYEPAYGKLTGPKIAAWWTFFFAQAKEFHSEFDSLKVNGDKATVHSEHWYYWNATGAGVHNLVESEFDFKDGKIFRQIDNYNLNAWAFQALESKFMGWTNKSREAEQERFEEFSKQNKQ